MTAEKHDGGGLGAEEPGSRRSPQGPGDGIHSRHQPPDDIHEIAGGWITERKNTPVPGFLKLSYIGFCIFGLVYLVSYWSGETSHATRGPLVEQANEIMKSPSGAVMGGLFVVIALFVAGLLWYAFFAKEE